MRLRLDFLCLLTVSAVCCFGGQPDPLSHLKLAPGFLQPAKIKLPKLAPKTLTAENRACGHILIASTSPHADRRMIMPVPRDYGSRMPIIKGLPVCQEDLRPAIRPAR